MKKNILSLLALCSVVIAGCQPVTPDSSSPASSETSSAGTSASSTPASSTPASSTPASSTPASSSTSTADSSLADDVISTLAEAATIGNYRYQALFQGKSQDEEIALDKENGYVLQGDSGFAFLQKYTGEGKVAYTISKNSDGSVEVGSPAYDTDADGNPVEVTEDKASLLNPIASIDTSSFGSSDFTVAGDVATITNSDFVAQLISASLGSSMAKLGIFDSVDFSFTADGSLEASVNFATDKMSLSLIKQYGFDTQLPTVIKLSQFEEVTDAAVERALANFKVPAALDTKAHPVTLSAKKVKSTFSIDVEFLDENGKVLQTQNSASGYIAYDENNFHLNADEGSYGTTDQFLNKNAAGDTNYLYIDASTGSLVSVKQKFDLATFWDYIYDSFDAQSFRATDKENVYLSYDFANSDMITSLTGFTLTYPMVDVYLDVSKSDSTVVYGQSAPISTQISDTEYGYAFLTFTATVTTDVGDALTAPAAHEVDPNFTKYITGKLDGSIPVKTKSSITLTDEDQAASSKIQPYVETYSADNLIVQAIYSYNQSTRAYALAATYGYVKGTDGAVTEFQGAQGSDGAWTLTKVTGNGSFTWDKVITAFRQPVSGKAVTAVKNGDKVISFVPVAGSAGFGSALGALTAWGYSSSSTPDDGSFKITVDDTHITSMSYSGIINDEYSYDETVTFEYDAAKVNDAFFTGIKDAVAKAKF